jgi:hypothetical protein
MLWTALHSRGSLGRADLDENHGQVVRIAEALSRFTGSTRKVVSFCQQLRRADVPSLRSRRHT